MVKTGRNEPCPCGSGKKFKKCCLGKATAGAFLPSRLTALERHALSSAADQGGEQGLHPYAVVKIVENPAPEVRAGLTKRDLAGLAARCSRAKVARLETSEIVERLQLSGIDASRSAFAPLAAGLASAWRLGEKWLGGLDHAPDIEDDDFVCLAACELWKRYTPDRPSLEMVDDWVTQGYDFLEASDNVKAVDIWLRVWEHVGTCLGPHIRTFSAADPECMLSQHFGNWVQDLEMELGNAAVDDRAYAEIGIRVLGEVAARFVDEEENTRLNFRCALGRLLFLAGRPAEGDVALTAVIQECPHSAHGYVALSDELSAPRSTAQDIPRAIALLEQALAYPVINADDWDIDARLSDLR